MSAQTPPPASTADDSLGHWLLLQDQLTHWFTHHPPQPEQIEQYQAIRAAGLAFARVIAGNTPRSADQSAAIRKVREAVMTANAAIACNGQ